LTTTRQLGLDYFAKPRHRKRRPGKCRSTTACGIAHLGVCRRRPVRSASQRCASPGAIQLDGQQKSRCHPGRRRGDSQGGFFCGALVARQRIFPAFLVEDNGYGISIADAEEQSARALTFRPDLTGAESRPRSAGKFTDANGRGVREISRGRRAVLFCDQMERLSS